MWTVNLVTADGNLIFLRCLCEYVWVNILTLSQYPLSPTPPPLPYLGNITSLHRTRMHIYTTVCTVQTYINLSYYDATCDWKVICLKLQDSHNYGRKTDIIQLCSGITHGRLLNGELYAQRFQKLIYLHLCTDCFMKISLQSSEQIQLPLLVIYRSVVTVF